MTTYISCVSSSAPDIVSTNPTHKNSPTEGGEGDSKLITVEEADTNILEAAGEEKNPVQEVPPEPTPSAPVPQSPEAPQEEGVQRRNMSSEKKKMRRIRTNSKVESVI